MRASNDFFVIGMAGIGTALLLTQLLIVSQQIVAANNHIQAELAAGRSAVPVNWIDAPRSRPIIESRHLPPPSPPRRPYPRVAYPELARKQHIGGYVDFDLIINPDGSISRSKIVAEEPKGYGFAAAAAKSLSGWRFEAASQPNFVAARRFRITFKPDD